MGPTTFKKTCRRHNIKRWPQRTFNSLDKLLKDLGTRAAENPQPQLLSDIEQVRVCR